MRIELPFAYEARVFVPSGGTESRKYTASREFELPQYGDAVKVALMPAQKEDQPQRVIYAVGDDFFTPVLVRGWDGEQWGWSALDPSDGEFSHNVLSLEFLPRAVKESLNVKRRGSPKPEQTEFSDFEREASAVDQFLGRLAMIDGVLVISTSPPVYAVDHGVVSAVPRDVAIAQHTLGIFPISERDKAVEYAALALQRPIDAIVVRDAEVYAPDIVAPTLEKFAVRRLWEAVIDKCARKVAEFSLDEMRLFAQMRNVKVRTEGHPDLLDDLGALLAILQRHGEKDFDSLSYLHMCHAEREADADLVSELTL